MHEASARSLRTVERFLLEPPLSGTFGSAAISICDISARGARFRHDGRLETGRKGTLKIPQEGKPRPIALEAVVVWSQPERESRKFVSGVRTYGSPEVIQSLIDRLKGERRGERIEELRAADRFHLMPALPGTFDAKPVRIDNLSAHGARIETEEKLAHGAGAALDFEVPDSPLRLSLQGRVVWTAMKTISGPQLKTYCAGLHIAQKSEQIRLAIGKLCELGRATLDTRSLGLKLKIMRARARQFASSFKSIEESGIPAEQYLLIQGVREELRLNPDEAMHWYRQARLVINDPATRKAAPVIVDHPDALAVWEYLERSVDPSIVGRAFALPAQ